MTLAAVQSSMKIDSRTLSPETLEAMRFMALDRMAEGELSAAISASFGIKSQLDVQGAAEGERTRPGPAGRAVAQGTGSAAAVDCGSRAAGVSVGQRQEPGPIRFRLRAADPPDRERVDPATVLRNVEPGLGVYAPGTGRADPSEAVAARLPTRP